MNHALFASLLALLWIANGCARHPNAPAILIEPLVSQTCPGLGACQGAAEHDGFVYLYGDANPGIIRQYRLSDSQPPTLIDTGLKISLTIDGKNVINHPTGLTWNPQYGLFLGNTVTATKKGTIYHLDWPRMLIDGNLDHAVLNVTDDDLAVQGCRPEFVRHGERWLIATADYGNRNNQVRFYDPARLITAKHTSEPGVRVAELPSGPYVQQLYWDDPKQALLSIQNKTAGKGWRVVRVDPWQGNGWAIFPPLDDLPRTDELEGFTLLSPTQAVMVTSSRENNVNLVRIELK